MQVFHSTKNMITIFQNWNYKEDNSNKSSLEHFYIQLL
jgi:hypothetical protein